MLQRAIGTSSGEPMHVEPQVFFGYAECSRDPLTRWACFGGYSRSRLCCDRESGWGSGRLFGETERASIQVRREEQHEETFEAQDRE